MTQESTPQVVHDYLAELDRALSGVPAEVRQGIVSGVAEELEGLDAAAAESRIKTLGDPAFIAAEARGVRSEAAADGVRSEPGTRAALVRRGHGPPS
jgi:uncharacterized membrane protein